MKIIVGLGNPGRAYDHTPHNIGFEVVDLLAGRFQATLRKSWRFPLISASVKIENEEVMLVKPQTFMNRSGDAVAPLMRKKGVSPDHLLVLVDDVELPLGSLRLRARGSAGTHNGLKSLIERLGTLEFPRLRIGVGPVPPGQDRVAFVLGRYPEERQHEVMETKNRSVDAVLTWLREGIERTMNKFNG